MYRSRQTLYAVAAAIVLPYVLFAEWYLVMPWALLYVALTNKGYFDWEGAFVLCAILTICSFAIF